MSKTRRTVLTLSVLLLLNDDARAAVISGQFQARLVIIAGCEVSNGAIDPGSVDSGGGLLDFGQQGPTWTQPLKAGLSETGHSKLEVACNPSVSGFTVTIDDTEPKSS